MEEAGHKRPDPLGDWAIPKDIPDCIGHCAQKLRTLDGSVPVPLEKKHLDRKTLMGSLPHGILLGVGDTGS